MSGIRFKTKTTTLRVTSGASVGKSAKAKSLVRRTNEISSIDINKTTEEGNEILEGGSSSRKGSEL